MKSFILICSILFSANINSTRDLFFSGNSENINTKLFELTKSAKLDQSPVRYAYNGLAIMRKAEYTYNPYKKLSFFNQGKKKIEAAIARNKTNSEIRFIRLSVQSNIPDFLGYSGDINADKRIIIQAINNGILSSNQSFNNNVIEFLFSNNLISKEIRQQLRGE